MVKKIFAGNKKGWVRVLEVFVSIMIVTSVIVLLITRGVSERDLSSEISSMEISILREIQLNETMRENILEVSPPINWSGFETNGLTAIKNKINEKKYSGIECEAKICSTRDNCFSDGNTTKNIYAEKAMISADINSYNPRQLKIFCWEK